MNKHEQRGSVMVEVAHLKERIAKLEAQLGRTEETAEYVIEIEGLSKTYPNKFTAVSGLTLKVPKGVFGFLGPNGAGKTTTIEILVGAMKPSSGTARVMGHDIVRDSLAVRRLIGYLPERPGFYDEMSGRRFLRYMGELSALDGRQASLRATELLDWVGLGGWADSPIARYSAGMKQRLGLAQSLINDPELLILDEPTANLDPLGRADFIVKVKELARQGKTIFVSTHIIPEMEQMADYVAIIAGGRLLVQGGIEELTQRREVKEYRIDVSQPELLVNELEARDFIVRTSLKDGQLLVESRDDDGLSAAIVAFCSDQHQQLHLFEPVRADLQIVFKEALAQAGRL